MQIRAFRAGDEARLHAVFYSSVHTLGLGFYSSVQLDAWAPRHFDEAAWAGRMQALEPFVAVAGEELQGYADLAAQGYIDHFFVAGHAARRGVGTALMRHIMAQARVRGIARLFADVSRCAQPFFLHHGFEVIEARTVEIRGEKLANARMECALGTTHSTSSL